MLQYKYRKVKGECGMARKRISKWDKNLRSVIKAQNEAIKRVNELRAAGWHVPEEVMKDIRKPLQTRYTEAQARKARNTIFSKRGINYSAYIMVGNQRVRRNSNYDMPYLTAINKVLQTPNGTEQLTKTMVRDMKKTLSPTEGSPSITKAAQWVELLSSLQKESGVRLLPPGSVTKLTPKAHELDIDPKALENAIHKSKVWSFREVGQYVYEDTPDIRGDRQEQIAKAKLTLQKRFNASPRATEALYDFFANSTYWKHLTSKNRVDVSEQIVSTLVTVDMSASNFDVNELDRRLSSGGDPVRVVEDYVRELINPEFY